MIGLFIPVQYLATGKVDKDQVADYAKRKGWMLEAADRNERLNTSEWTLDKVEERQQELLDVLADNWSL